MANCAMYAPPADAIVANAEAELRGFNAPQTFHIAFASFEITGQDAGGA